MSRLFCQELKQCNPGAEKINNMLQHIYIMLLHRYVYIFSKLFLISVLILSLLPRSFACSKSITAGRES